MTTELLLYLGIIAIVTILVSVLFSRKTKAFLSKNGFSISADNKEKDEIKMSKIKKSNLDIKNKENQNIGIDDVDESEIKIK